MRVERIKSALQADTWPLGFQCIKREKAARLAGRRLLENLDLYGSLHGSLIQSSRSRRLQQTAEARHTRTG